MNEVKIPAPSGWPGAFLILVPFVVFTVLKTTGHVDWPWWIVTISLWIYPVFVLGFVVLTLGAMLVVGLIAGCIVGGVWIIEGIASWWGRRRLRKQLKGSGLRKMRF